MARILLIDDDDAVRTMLRLTLAQFGHEVVEARNGQEGLTAFHNLGADVVITDIVMPEKEGLEVIMQLRKSHPGVGIIAISGGGRGEPANYLRLAKFMGARSVLDKPFSNAALIAAISEALDRGSAHDLHPSTCSERERKGA